MSRFLEEPPLRLLMILNHCCLSLPSAHELIDIVAEQLLDVRQVLVMFFLLGFFFFWAVYFITFIGVVFWIFGLVLVISLVPLFFFVFE